MYQLEIDQASSKAVLFLSGSMTVNVAQEIKEAIQNALAGTGHLIIDQSSVEEYDLTFMQLLISLYKTANSIGKTIAFIGSDSSQFKSLLSDCGCPEFSWLGIAKTEVKSEDN